MINKDQYYYKNQKAKRIEIDITVSMRIIGGDMRSKRNFAIFFALISATSSVLAADAQKVLQCLGEDGKVYKTTQPSCPNEMPEVRKKIRSCTLPNGSKAFGDKCPQGSAAKEALDSEKLSSRTHGISNPYQNDERRMIQQGESERNYLRMKQQMDLNSDDRDRQIRAMRERQNERAYRPDP